MTSPSTPAPVAPETPWQQATVERVVRQTSRVASLFLRASIGRHDAGQHVDVRLTAPDGYQAQRSYSIASAPDDPALELAVERLDDGEVSPYLHDVLQPGDTLEVRGPIGGHFVWRAEDGGPLLLVAGGSGIAPLMAILRHRARVAPGTEALLAYSARTWDDLVFRDELLDAEARDAKLHVAITTTRAPRHRESDFQRRLDAPLIGELLGRLAAPPKLVYVCGATTFVETVANALVDLRISPQRVRTERYGGA